MNPREWLGKQIREYHLTDIIGSGGMSAVFRGKHVKLQVERAVKVLRPDLAHDPQFVRRFEQEARILAILEHPHLIRVFEFFEEKGFLFIVMEIAQGESLEDLVLYHGVIPANEMWQIVDQAAQGLQYAHDKGIVHRDLSPDNLMVAGYDERNINVKVIDFGIARPDAFNPESRKIMETGQTTSNAFIGKLRYCSPEQAMEVPIDHRSDQYTLALIFLECITGKPTFSEGSPITALMRRVKEAPPRLSDLVPGSAWPSDVDRVLERALQSSPVERYSSITEFSETLGRALGVNQTDTEEEPARKQARNRPVREIEDDESTIQASGRLIPEVMSLAETMRTTPDLTIYPGSHGSRSEPRYGRVQAPPPRRAFPWVRISLLILLAAAVSSYFLLPDNHTLSIKRHVNRFAESGYQAIIDQMDRIDGSEKQESKPAPGKPVKSRSQEHKWDSGSEPYWFKRSGVVAPIIHGAAAQDLPRHLEERFKTPVKVVVQCVILKTGKLGQCTVLNSVDPFLDDLAMQAVRSWTYSNGTLNGRPVDIMMDVEVTFK